MVIIKSIFFVLTFIVFYTYTGYGIIAWFISFLKKIFTKPSILVLQEELPAVTLVIPAFNEGAFIQHKIDNTALLDYPQHLLSVYIVTDGSTDNTVSIVQQYNSKVQLFHNTQRNGKMAALNRIMPQVSTPIVVFSDANTLLNRNSIREIVKHYTNPKVGGVAGEKKIIAQNNSNSVGEGEGLYWQYESAMKQLDSDLYTVVAAAGELFSIRTNLYKPQPNDTIIDDLMLAISVCKQGYTIVYEKTAFAIEAPSINLKEERKRKVRIAAGAAQAFYRIGLFPSFTNWMLNFQYISRRILRWVISPIALPTIFTTNLLLVYSYKTAYWYNVSFIAQIVFYIMAILGWILYRLGKKNILFFAPFYFVFMNMCMIVGFIKQTFSHQSVNWEKAKRSSLTSNITSSTIL